MTERKNPEVTVKDQTVTLHQIERAVKAIAASGGKLPVVAAMAVEGLFLVNQEDQARNGLVHEVVHQRVLYERDYWRRRAAAAERIAGQYGAAGGLFLTGTDPSPNNPDQATLEALEAELTALRGRLDAAEVRTPMAFGSPDPAVHGERLNDDRFATYANND